MISVVYGRFDLFGHGKLFQKNEREARGGGKNIWKDRFMKGK